MTAPLLARSEKGLRLYSNPITGRDNYLSVSNIKSQLDTGPGLLKWFGRLAAEYAVDHTATWQACETRTDAVKLISAAADRARNDAAQRGTDVHDFAHQMAQGIEVTPSAVAWSAADPGYVAALQRFVGEWSPQFVATETTVFSDEHGYAGTFDAMAVLPALSDQAFILDYKTGSVFGDQALQLAAYRHAEYGVVEGTLEPYERLELPPVAGGAIVKLSEDGTYQLIPMNCGQETFQTFVSMIPLARFAKRLDTLIGQPWQPPRSLTAEKRRQMLDRMTALRAHVGAVEQLAELWHRTGVPSFKQQTEHTLQQLNTIDVCLCTVEDIYQAAFTHTPPDPAQAAPVPLPDNAVQLVQPGPEPVADPAAVRLVVEALGALPADLLAAVEGEAMRAGVPNLNRGPVTDQHLTTLLVFVTEAQTQSQARAAAVAEAPLVLGDEDNSEIVDMVNKLIGATVPDLYTRLQADQFCAMFTAINQGVVTLGIDNDGWSCAVLERALVETAGTKTLAVAAGKRLAAEHRRQPPRSTAALVADTILSALVAAETTTTTTTQETPA